MQKDRFQEEEKCMVRNRRPGLWLLAPIILMLWYCCGCRGNAPADQPGKAAAGNQADQTHNDTGASPPAGQPFTNDPDDLIFSGVRGAPVRIDVFSDYQCPRCGEFYRDTIKPLADEYTRTNKINKILIVYHDFPLEMHPYARKASRFALAAARIGRDRWLRVNDQLYREQAQWAIDGNIEASLAKVLDPTDLVRITNLAAKPEIDAAVQNGVMLGQSREIGSTPTFFITSPFGPQQKVAGGVAYATLKDFLDRLMK
jgi:protein-disulfide isomerase